MKNLGNRLGTFVVAALALASTSVFAEVPAYVATGVTAAQADGLGVVELIGPAVMAVAVGWLIVKFIKKGIGKIG